MVIMTESPLFLPCLVPHLFCQRQSSTPMSTSASDRDPTHLSTTPSSPSRSLSPMSATSDPHFHSHWQSHMPQSRSYTPMSITSDSDPSYFHTVPLTRSPTTRSDPDSDLITSGVPRVSLASRSSESPESRNGPTSASDSIQPRTWPVTIPMASQARPQTLTPADFLDAIINCDNGENVARLFVSLYSFSPEDVHAAISRLASGSQSDRRNLLEFLTYIFESNSTIATEILAQYFAGQGQ